MVFRLEPPSLRPALAAATVSVCTALLGCGTGDPSSVRTQTRDSAGVAIVESTALPERGAGGWTLSQAPFLTIGTFEGDTLYQLYQVSGAVRLPDGRIAISDNGSFQLRIFGPDGTFQHSWGREGEGPGEFQAIRVMGVLDPDTLVVLDGRLRRISLFLPEKGLVEQSTVEEDVGMTFVANGMFQDGSIVFGGGLSFGPGGEIPTDGLSRGGTSYRSASLDGSLAADFGTVPGPEVFVRTQGGGGEYMVSASTIPFARRPAASVRGDRFYVGSSDTYEIAGYDATGQLDRILRVSQPPSPVTSSEVDRLIQERVTNLDDPSQAPALRAALRDMPTPPTIPAYQSLVVDAEGCVWVEDFQRPGVGLRSWTVFDADGRPRTRLSLPASNRVLEVGSDYVMAVFEDALGVEYLRLYGLTRGR